MMKQLLPFSVAALMLVASGTGLYLALRAPSMAPAQVPGEAPGVHPGLYCNRGVQHPLHVRVTPRGDVQRGDMLSLEVEMTTDQALENAQVRLTQAGGAETVGPALAELGPLAVGERAVSQFTVRVPQKGPRFLLQFEVRGEGPTGVITRGATYNILPEGPADPGRVEETPLGRKLRSYEASARRIDR